MFPSNTSSSINTSSMPSANVVSPSITPKAMQNAIDYAKQDPTSSYAQELQKRIQSGAYNDTLRMMGKDTSKYGQAPVAAAPQPAKNPDHGYSTDIPTNPVATGIKNFVDDTTKNFTGAISDAGTKIVNDAQTEGAKASATTNPLAKVGDTALGITHVAGDLTGGAGAALTAPIATSVKNISDLISNSPAVQKISMELPDFQKKIADITAAHPELVHTLSDLFNVGTAVVAPEAAEGKVPLSDTIDSGIDSGVSAVKTAANATKDSVAAVADSAAGTVKDVAGAAKGMVTPDPDASFEKSLNKAFPPSKKEFNLGDKRIDSAKAAFKDIIANKDTNGITDEKGDIKDPKDYTFQDTLDAQDKRMPQIYKDYTSKLEGVDKGKFESSITQTVVDAMDSLDKSIAKENSVPDRQAMSTLKKEIGGLRDTSPIGMQDYLQKLGQRTRTAPGAPLTPEQVQTANLAGKIKAGLDSAVDATGESGYNEGRQLYTAHKTMQDAFIRAALKEVRATPGLMDKLTNLGMTGEGIQFLLTHNPASLITMAGVKGANQLMKWFASPGRALKNIYKMSESQSNTPSSLSPQATNSATTKSTMNMPDSIQPAQESASPDGKPSILEQKPDVGLGMSMKDMTQKLNFYDKQLLQKYIDSVRVSDSSMRADRPVLSKSEESDIFKMNELLGIKGSASSKAVANKYEQILNSSRQ